MKPAVIEAAASKGDWDVILTSYNFQQSYRKELDTAVHKAVETGIGISRNENPGGGRFSGQGKNKAY